MLSSICTSSFALRSSTRSFSVFPPPLVKRMKGMLFFCNRDNALCARGIGSEDRTRTPSILCLVNQMLFFEWDENILESKCNVRLRVLASRLQIPSIQRIASNRTKLVCILHDIRSRSTQAGNHRRRHRKDWSISTTEQVTLLQHHNQ